MKTFGIFCAAAAFTGLAFAQPSIFSGGVLNGASFAKGQAVAPGGEVAIFGSGLASSLVSASTVPLSSNLGGTTVTVNGVPAGLYFVSDGQVNAQLPWETQPGTAAMVVSSGSGSSAPLQFQVTSAAPGVFSIPPGAGYAVAVNNADGSLAAPVGAIQGAATHPAKVGDALIVYANGLGAVNPSVSDGGIPSNPGGTSTALPPVVLIGGQQAQVLFSGLTPQFPGINQLNIIVPPGVSGNSLPLQIQMNGITSTNQVVIAVQ